MAAATRAGPARALPQRAVRAVRACVHGARTHRRRERQALPAAVSLARPASASRASNPLLGLLACGVAVQRGNPPWLSFPSDLGN